MNYIRSDRTRNPTFLQSVHAQSNRLHKVIVKMLNDAKRGVVDHELTDQALLRIQKLHDDLRLVRGK
jgi:hypothetical protein